MDKGAWQAIVHGVARVGHNLVTSETIMNMTVVILLLLLL